MNENAKEAILEAAQQQGAYLIVMGTHGRRGAARFRLDRNSRRPPLSTYDRFVDTVVVSSSSPGVM